MTKKAERVAKAAAARALLFGDDDEKTNTPQAGVPVTSDVPRKRDRDRAHVKSGAGGRAKGPAAPVVEHTDTQAGVINRGIRAERGDVNVGSSFDYPTIPKEHWPKKHAPGSLPVNTPVWYHGGRYYVEYAPSDWSRGTGVRISSARIPDGQLLHHGLTRIASVFRNGQECLTSKRESFFVHPDELTLAPVMTHRAELAGRTVSENQAKAKARGDKDIGDPVALMLRGKDLEAAYAQAADYLRCPIFFLKQKYGHLNPGQQRMNLGNKMRAKWRKEQHRGVGEC